MINLIRYIILSLAGSKLTFMSGVALHGLAYTFFYSVAYIYLDQHTTREERAGVHQLYRIMTAGLGNILGNFSTGKSSDLLGVLGNSPDNYKYFWLIPAGLVLIAAILPLNIKSQPE